MGELLRRVSSAELTEWQAFYRLEAEDRQREALAAEAKAAVRARRAAPRRRR